MKKIILLALFTFTIFASNAYCAVLQKGENVFTRSNLRAEKRILFWHNFASAPEVIPAGTEVKIVSCKGQGIVFTKGDGENKYKLVANAMQWDKYFVKDKNEIKLESFFSTKKDQISKSEIAVGMTKEEVYTAKGCPAYIAYGAKSYDRPLSDIMKSDTWYYMKDSRRHEKLVKFEKNVVASIGDY
jgi:hypothetical protein